MKKITALMLSSAMMLSLAACGGSASTETVSSEAASSEAASSEAVSTEEAASADAAAVTTVNAGKLTMSTNAAFPPYEMTTDNGDFEGIDIEVAGAIAKKLGLELQVDDMDFDAALLAAQQCGLPYVVTLTDFFVGCYRINAINAQGQPCSGPDEGRSCVRDCLVPEWTEPALLQRHQLAKALLQGAIERVAPSEYVAEFFRASFPELPLRVIPHGIDFLALMGNGQSVVHAHEDLAPEAPITLGYVGAIVAQKGLHILLQALQRVPAGPGVAERIAHDAQQGQAEQQVQTDANRAPAKGLQMHDGLPL